jgi:hypothetical protein
MAEIRRGKLKGQKAKISQYCNDWFSIEVGGTAKIVSPLALKLTPKERAEWCKSAARGQVGTQLHEYRLNLDGTFTRRALK